MKAKFSTSLIQSLLTHYKRRFLFERFYDNLLFNISAYPQQHIVSKTFLSGYCSTTNANEVVPNILTKNGDTRVDLPIWFGNPNAANKIVIIGLEPRDTDKTGRLNIERCGNYVFATPFALERPSGHYYTAFQPLMNKINDFIYFTDAVKTYQVNNIDDKLSDDKLARQSFFKRAYENKTFLLDELEIIKPSKLIAVGNDSFNFLNQLLENKYDLFKIRHPSHGGSKIAKHQLSDIVDS